MTVYIEANKDAAAAILERGIEGPVVLLNLLRFRELADYSHAPQHAPEQPVSGAEAYKAYMAATRPMIERAGARLTFIGQPTEALIGPQDEKWDLMLLVEYPSIEAFFKHTGSADTRETIHHRQAALADSRLVPVVPGRPG
ncbi:DUF1330 domain-containing protein [Aurantiacibacter poecillastricola]|uniref:DUF1330 domain-containing protein n=1 Tax=Aurantiacibacter poecillastricola TaxID=3064385 RepID=UPI0027401BAC|nr:DUF1330 domain-containing protein [Aurantiacibacter sp. 219JJ12-13]MDP5261039.1 DUF1330 domain-containing protein [Aurantiacibacter sp. 219JJ12-13]